MLLAQQELKKASVSRSATHPQGVCKVVLIQHVSESLKADQPARHSVGSGYVMPAGSQKDLVFDVLGHPAQQHQDSHEHNEAVDQQACKPA
jgi:hypothetical protein